MSDWKHNHGTYDSQGNYKTLAQLEAEGWKFDYDGSELREILSKVTFDPAKLKVSVEGKKSD